MDAIARGYLEIRRAGLCPINEKMMTGEKCSIDGHMTNEAECMYCSKKRAVRLYEEKKES